MAFGAVCPSLQTTWLIYILKNNKTITYCASDNKSEDAKLTINRPSHNVRVYIIIRTQVHVLVLIALYALPMWLI